MSQQKQQIQQIVQQAVLQSATQLERQLDKEIERFQNPDEDDLEQIRRQRLAQLKLQAKERQEWDNLGHGKMNELSEQKEFFDCCKHSKRVVALFFTPTNEYCRVVEEHLTVLANRHKETKFIKIHAEKSPFLVDRLKIWMMPTVVLIKDQKTEYSIVGLDELNKGKFETRDLEKILLSHEVIDGK
jgi:thiol-disulfide isomerase/thioredoxin